MIQKIADLPQQQQIMVLVVLLAGLGAFWWYYVNPIGAEIETLESQILELGVEVERAVEIERRLPEFKEELDALLARMDELRGVLPDEKETAEIVRRVEQLAVESNLDIQSFTPQGTEPSGFYERWPINIALEGNYNNLGLFFQRVAQFTRIINVDNISIRGLGGTDQQRSIAATCTATTFVLADKGS